MLPSSTSVTINFNLHFIFENILNAMFNVLVLLLMLSVLSDIDVLNVLNYIDVVNVLNVGVNCCCQYPYLYFRDMVSSD